MSDHRSFKRLRLLIAAACAVILALAFTAPASASSSSTARTWRVNVAAETPDDAIQTMAFMPGTVWINAGDSILWTVRAGEIHTVTFLKSGTSLPEFDPFNPMHLLPQGGTSYDGHSYYNSGLLSDEGAAAGFPVHMTYTLKFPKTGNFTYWCLVHGKMMKGTVHVRAAGTKYPFTQADYNRQAAKKKAADISDGMHLWQKTAQKANNHNVYAGADDGIAMVMRFIDQRVTVHVGQRVTFRNTGMAAPHTVTFGTEPANIFAPLGDPTHFAGGQLSSGILLPGHTFTVTFTKAGRYPYICALHDFLGMVGTVTVTK